MNNKKYEENIISGKSAFCVDIPYRIIESGKKTVEKPLIVYLHGFKDNLKSFQKTCIKCIERIEAYHLFIQGPYPIYDRSKENKVDEWGRAWYLYDGDQGQFLKSLEHSSQFLQNLIESLRMSLQIKRICIMGYSMGGYLAGYFSMTRSKYVNELIVVGARIKTEVLKDQWNVIQHLQVLALHGSNDNLVDYKPQRSEIKRLKENSVNANFKLIDQKHIFTEEYRKEMCNWLFEKGYSQNEYFKND